MNYWRHHQINEKGKHILSEAICSFIAEEVNLFLRKNGDYPNALFLGVDEYAALEYFFTNNPLQFHSGYPIGFREFRGMQLYKTFSRGIFPAIIVEQDSPTNPSQSPL